MRIHELLSFIRESLFLFLGTRILCTYEQCLRRLNGFSLLIHHQWLGGLWSLPVSVELWSFRICGVLFVFIEPWQNDIESSFRKNVYFCAGGNDSCASKIFLGLNGRHIQQPSNECPCLHKSLGSSTIRTPLGIIACSSRFVETGISIFSMQPTRCEISWLRLRMYARVPVCSLLEILLVCNCLWIMLQGAGWWLHCRQCLSMLEHTAPRYVHRVIVLPWLELTVSWLFESVLYNAG